MARKKVDLTYITKDWKRNATLKKRKNGLIKKIDEISILCGIEACTIIYTPNNPRPEVWPSDLGVQNVLSRFRTVSELEQSKKKLCQESFLRQRITKAQAQLRKLRNEAKKKEVTLHMFQYLDVWNNFDNASMIELNDVSNLIDQNMEEVQKKINMSQDHEVNLIVESGGETIGEQAIVNHVQGSYINVIMEQKENLSMNINNVIVDEMFPMGDANAPSS